MENSNFDIMHLNVSYIYRENISNSLIFWLVKKGLSTTYFKHIFDHFGDKIFELSDDELIRYVISNKIFKFNSFLDETYRKNFKKLRQEEL